LGGGGGFDSSGSQKRSTVLSRLRMSSAVSKGSSVCRRLACACDFSASQ